VDALLGQWPALGADDRPLPPEDDAAWEARADAIVAAARGAKADKAAAELLLAAPNLPAEAGEPRAPQVELETDPRARSVEQRASRPGEFAMSSESDGSGGSKPASMPPNSVAPMSQSPTSGRPRQSLREMAERAQSGRASIPAGPLSTPLPGRASVPSTPPSVGRAPSSPALTTPRPATATPIPGVKRPVEASSDDSGVVNLNVVNASTDATTRAAAEKAKPGEASLFDDEPAKKDAAVAAKPAAKDSKDKTKVVAAAPAAKGGSGASVGIVIALLGIAAGIAIWQVRKGGNSVADEGTTKPAVTADAPTAAKTAGPDGTAKPSPVAQAAPADDQGLDPDKLGDDRAPTAAGHGVKLGGPLPKAGAGAAPSAAPVAEVAKPTGSVGTLGEEIERAAGGKSKSGGNAGDQEPAGGAERSKTLPERPSQGAVQAAIGQVLGNAKACVSEADEATRATVTFKSSGDVAGVTVTGWASANGKSGCVVSALKGAKVGAFTDPNYSFPVTIRP
jgi:hypothetical protein